MRHGKSFNHLGRKTPHRHAMLSNMASSLITKKRITTTVAKAKALRQYVEPIITKAKDDTTQSRRIVFSYLQDKGSVQVLFDEVAAKIADRPGGYTRIIKLADARLGDSSSMCIIELVDYNDLMLSEESTRKTRTRRSRRGGGGSKAGETKETAAKEEKKAPKAEKAEAKSYKAEATAEAEPKAEAQAEESKAEAKAAEPKAEAPETTEPKGEDTSAGDKNKKEDQE